MLRSHYVKAPFKWLKKGELANQITLLFNSRVLVHKNDQEDSRNVPGGQMQLNKNV